MWFLFIKFYQFLFAGTVEYAVFMANPKDIDKILCFVLYTQDNHAHNISKFVFLSTFLLFNG